MLTANPLLMPGNKVRFADYEVDFVTRELRKRGTRIELQPKPFRVLELLIHRAGEFVTHEELYRNLWPDSHVEFNRSLYTAVNSLRQALEQTHGGGRFIETRAGLGYRFCAPLEKAAGFDYAAGSRDAYQDCVRGRYLLDRQTEDDVHKAIALFNAALSDDHCLSLAHAGLADAYCHLALLGSVPAQKLAESARVSANIALKRNPDLIEAYVASARVKGIFDWDWETAEALIKDALLINESSSLAQIEWARLLLSRGRLTDALEICRGAVASDPVSIPANLQLAACLYGLRDYRGCVEQCWKVLAILPAFAPFQFFLAAAYEQLGMYEESLIEFESTQTNLGYEASCISARGHVYGAAGMRSHAERMKVELSALAQRRHVSPVAKALVELGLQNEKASLAFVKQALEERDPALLSAKADPRFEGLIEFPSIRAPGLSV